VFFVGQPKELAPVVDIIKTVRSAAKDKSVTIKAEISADVDPGDSEGARRWTHHRCG